MSSAYFRENDFQIQSPRIQTLILHRILEVQGLGPEIDAAALPVLLVLVGHEAVVDRAVVLLAAVLGVVGLERPRRVAQIRLGNALAAAAETMGLRRVEVLGEAGQIAERGGHRVVGFPADPGTPGARGLCAETQR